MIGDPSMASQTTDAVRLRCRGPPPHSRAARTGLWPWPAVPAARNSSAGSARHARLVRAIGRKSEPRQTLRAHPPRDPSARRRVSRTHGGPPAGTGPAAAAPPMKVPPARPTAVWERPPLPAGRCKADRDPPQRAGAPFTGTRKARRRPPGRSRPAPTRRGAPPGKTDAGPSLPPPPGRGGQGRALSRPPVRSVSICRPGRRTFGSGARGVVTSRDLPRWVMPRPARPAPRAGPPAQPGLYPATGVLSSGRP